MMMKKYWAAACLITLSCQQQQQTEKENHTAMVVADTMKSKPAFTPDQVDNAKDPVCGMPVKAGITDTVHYKKKIYGFCAAGCKDAFMADKAKYAASAKMKESQ